MKIDLIRFRFLASEADNPLTLDIPVAETLALLQNFVCLKGFKARSICGR